MQRRKAVHDPGLLCRCLLAVVCTFCGTVCKAENTLRVGGYVQNINPEVLPVRINGGFVQQMADTIVDPLAARTLVIACGKTLISLTVVDSCLMPRSLIDAAKQLAAQQTGIPVAQMLVSATHAHSAPAVFGIHGSEVSPEYVDQLTRQIADSIIRAHANLQSAEVGWARKTLDKYIYCRRWLMNPGTALTIPFTGRQFNQVQMNPGHNNENRLSQTGPVDTDVMVLAFRKPIGEPLALLGNFNTHYAGAKPVSSDYFGHFCRNIGQRLRAPADFVALMSNGTSGDANCIDYSQKDAVPFTALDVANAVMEKAETAYHSITEWHSDLPLSMVQNVLTLDVRTPGEDEVQAARETTRSWMDQRLPETMAEVYQRETILLSELPAHREIVLQTLRLGDFAITATPCEVYGETGLRIKQNSPFALTMNIGLANDYAGYLPPPEQHRLGGYSTWRARSSCLEEEAEPKIYGQLMRMLQQLDQMPPLPGEASIRSTPHPAHEALEMTEVLPGLKVELAACEPDVMDPVSIAFDAHGRMWVVEMRDYPTGPVGGDSPRGRIQLLQDKDRDGFFESATTFADGLVMPTGLTCFRDGVVATLAGQIVYLADEDGDLRCDRQEVWFTGFSETNEQLRANHPTWTLANRIHVASGLRGGEIVSANARWPQHGAAVSLAARDFAFDPFGGAYGAVIGDSQFGFYQDREGFHYVCDNRHPCRRWLVSFDRVAANPVVPLSSWVVDIMPAAEESEVFPLVDAWTTSTLHAGQFTAACGVFRYESDLLHDWIGNDYFSCEPTGSLVQRYRSHAAREDGAIVPRATRGRAGVEFLASRDPWFRPVDLLDGPDGGLYIVDMHRAVIEHPEWAPDELKHRKDERWGDTAGRIYRVVPSDREVNRTGESLQRLSASALVDLLGNANRWKRLTAARLLAERIHENPATVRSQIAALLSRCIMDCGAGNDDARLQALWLLRACDQIPWHADGHAAFQMALVELASTHENVPQLESLLSRWATHDDPRVRLAFLERFANAGVSGLGQLACDCLARSCADGAADREWLGKAFSQLADPRGVAVLRFALQSELVLGPEALGQLVGPTARRLGWDGSLLAFESLWRAEPGSLVLQLRSQYLAGMREKGHSVHAVLKECDPETVDQWHEDLRQAVAVICDTSRRADEQLTALQMISVDHSEIASRCRREVIRSGDDRLLLTAAEPRVISEDSVVRHELISRLPGLGPLTASIVIQRLVDCEPGRSDLLGALLSETLPSAIIDPVARNNLSRSLDPARQQALTALFPAPDHQPAELVEVYAAALHGSADISRGREQFARCCASCHCLEGVGFAVGPDLSDLRTQTPEQLLVSILDPSAAIDANYIDYTVMTLDGQVHSGLLLDQNAKTIVLGQQNGVRVALDRTEVESWRPAGRSMMPDGFEQQIPPDAMRDLIQYLKAWRQQPKAAPATGAAHARCLHYTAASHGLRGAGM